MLKHILPLIPEHKLYTEAFCGGAAVFFAKEPAEGEVINDINMHLVNFYNTLQLDYDALKAKIDSASMLDGAFGYDFGGGMPKKLRNAKEEFCEQLADRLEQVTIESRHAFEVIETYDGPTTFHFVDPPYVNSDCGHYEGVFGDADLGRLLDLLEQVQGKFMLTMFPHGLIEAYAQRNGWTIHRIERFISASKTSRRKQEEWMVCNYTKEEEPTLFD